MNQIDWAGKLSSRKFWVFLLAVATIAFGVIDNRLTYEAGTMALIGACAAYCLGEGAADLGAGIGGAFGGAIPAANPGEVHYQEVDGALDRMDATAKDDDRQPAPPQPPGRLTY